MNKLNCIAYLCWVETVESESFMLPAMSPRTAWFHKVRTRCAGMVWWSDSKTRPQNASIE